jgi:hypothetical protein
MTGCEIRKRLLCIIIITRHYYVHVESVGRSWSGQAGLRFDGTLWIGEKTEIPPRFPSFERQRRVSAVSTMIRIMPVEESHLAVHERK